MEQYLDSISDAYHGKLGPRMAQKTRERVHWIIKNSTGDNILDVGCSQGLVSILLAREGKTVVGIDIAKDSIDFANTSLLDEQEKTRELTKFIHGNFLFEELPENHFDTIIITEVLEHFVTSKEMLKKTKSLLIDKGQVIITVPFGINDFPDHKRTLYLMEIYQEMLPHFNVEKVEFMGKWIGFIGTKGNSTVEAVPEHLFIETEKAFYVVERELTDQNKNLKEQLGNYKSRFEELKNKEKTLLTQQAEQKEKNNDLSKKIKSLEEKLSAQMFSNEKLREENKEKEAKQLEISERLKKQLEESKTVIRGLQTDNNRMEEKIATMIKNFSDEKDKNEGTTKQLKNTIVALKRQLEEKDLQISEQIHHKENLEIGYKTEIKALQENCHHFSEQVNKVNEEIKLLKIHSEQQLEQVNNRNEKLVNENKELHHKTKQLHSEKEEILVRHLKDLEELEQQSSGMGQAQKTIEGLRQEIQGLEKELEREKCNFSLTIKENQEMIQNLNTQVFKMQRIMQVDEVNQKKEELELKENLNELLEDAEELTKKLIKEMKEKDQLQRKYESLKNSKLGKMTMKYWDLRRK